CGSESEIARRLATRPSRAPRRAARGTGESAEAALSFARQSCSPERYCRHGRAAAKEARTAASVRASVAVLRPDCDSPAGQARLGWALEIASGRWVRTRAVERALP